MVDVKMLKSRVTKLLNINKNDIMEVDIVEVSPDDDPNEGDEPIGKINKRKIPEKAAENRKEDHSDEYKQIQAIFTNYPGLFSFTSITSNKNVWCKACKKETTLIGLAEHVKSDGHSQYYQENSPRPSVVPDFQIIFDRFPGVFSLTPNNSTLWCNACNKEATRINLTRHLNAATHLKNVAKALKKEINYDNVASALSDKVFSNISSGQVYCNVCEKELNDSLAELKKHLESQEHENHSKNSDFFKKRGIDAVLADFGHDISLVDGKLWCKKCKVTINNSAYRNVERHVSTSIHLRNSKLVNDLGDATEVPIEEFHQDLAQFFRQNRIPLKKLSVMKPFFVKYIQRHIPDESTLRKRYLNDNKNNDTNNVGNTEKKKAKKRLRKEVTND